MREFDEDPELSAFTRCLAELADLDARVERYLRLNKTDQAAILMSDMRDLGRRLRESRRALEDRIFASRSH